MPDRVSEYAPPAEWTPGDINHNLVRAMREIERKDTEHRHAALNRVDCERVYRMEHSKALLRSEAPSADKREAEVHLAVEQYWRDFEIAKALESAAKQALNAAFARLNGWQSVSGNIREEMRLSGR